MLVSVSGIDGSGKTLIAKLVVENLLHLGFDAVYSRPKYKACKQFEYYLYQSRGESTCFDQYPYSHIYTDALIIDWLTHATDFLLRKTNQVVVMDRYFLDVLAQCIHFGGAVKNADWLEKDIPKEDMGFFLDVSPGEACERISRRNAPVRKYEEYGQLVVLDSIYRELLHSRFREVVRVPNLSPDVTAEFVSKSIIHHSTLLTDKKRKNHTLPPLAPICECCNGYMYP